MMRPYGEGLKVYLYREPVNMRMWRNGLAAVAQQVMKVDPFSGALVIFVGEHYNAVKILYWHRNGFAVWHKVIEGPEKSCWPRLMEQEVVTLTAEETRVAARSGVNRTSWRSSCRQTRKIGSPSSLPRAALYVRC